jgi:REP element-mobilizing transposase RayT
MIHQQLNQYQFAWQRNYHEHIIRDDSGLEEIRKYIMNNPVNWKDDDLWVE